jgi:hypothetical protein
MALVAPSFVGRLVVLLVALALALAPMTGASAAERELFVATNGHDGNPGTQAEPFRTVEQGLRALRGGDTLYVRGGVYEERIQDVGMPSATAGSPTRVLAYPGERPVVRGLLWIRGGSHWVLDGIDVTWDTATGSSNEHMVKVTNGTDWVVRDVEIYGARSYAGMLIAGTRAGEPARWKLADSCIRDTRPTNNTNQDHNLYVNTGLDAGPGLVEGNIFFGAPNGENVKLGPPSDSGGVANVVVRHNTLYDAAQNLLISGGSRDNVVERNLVGRTRGNYGNLRSYRISGTNNVARDNVGFAASSIIDNYDGGNGVEDGGGNRFPVDPGFDRTDSCAGFISSNVATATVGHAAADDTAPAPAPTPDEPAAAPDGPAPTPETPSDDAGDEVAGDETGFSDVAPGNVHAPAIAELRELGILLGATDTHFRPKRNVSRAQVATGLHRLLVGTETMPAISGASVTFADVEGSSPHEASITDLATLGVLEGTDGRNFEPGTNITRGQLASVLVRAHESMGRSIPVSDTDFTDLDGSLHADNIRSGAALGLIHGYADGGFRPQERVTREQFASMLHRYYELLADGQAA